MPTTDHVLEKVNGRYQCKVCGKSWKGKNPQTYCVGVWIYDRHQAPENLKTKSQLRKMWLKPGGPIRAVVGVMEFALFDLAEAIPYTAEEIAAVKEQARAERHAYRYRTCKHCTQEVKKENYSDDWKCCLDCLPAVKEAYRKRRAAEEAEEQAEFEAFLTRERDKAIKQARAWLTLGEKAVILDTETTGLDGEVIEIGIIDLNGNALINQRVKPQGEMSQGAFAVHGISLEMLADCPTYDQVFPLVNQVVNGKTVIVYNAAFDSHILCFSGWLYKLPDLHCDWACAMEVYAQYYGEWSEYHRSFKWQRLQGGDHSAVGDCKATLELIQRMANADLSTEQPSEEQQHG